MKISPKVVQRNDLSYIIRSAKEDDAKQLSALRLQVDGETEHFDREPGEGFIDEQGFQELIRKDTRSRHCLFLVAEAEGNLVGFSRCAGSELKRLSHHVEFGVGVKKTHWCFGIGTNLLKESLKWANQQQMKKMTLRVLETNKHAMDLYTRLGFEVEGVLKADKRLSDGKYYNTVMMAHFFSGEEK